MPGPWEDYTWVMVVGSLTAFCFAWSIGANDVANAFGTSVGAKTLKLWQACLVAAVFEFTGALTLGRAVTATIAQNISDASAFSEYPEIYMYGMLCSLAAATMWVTYATYSEMAVSSTHAVIGAIIGFSLVWHKGHSVHWIGPDNNFPYFSGVLPIVLSWVASPLIAGLLAAVIFLCTRTLILRRKRSEILAMCSLPVLVFFTILVDLFFILLKGAGAQLDWNTLQCFWVSVVAAGGLTCLVAAIGLPLLVRRFRGKVTSQGVRYRASSESSETSGGVNMHRASDATSGRDTHQQLQPPAPPAHVELALESVARPSMVDSVSPKTSTAKVLTATGVWDTALAQETFVAQRLSWRQVLHAKLASAGSAVYSAAVHGLVQDVHEHLEDDPTAVAMHQAAEIFEPQAEMVFKYLQVISACCVSFAHGSNDVANAVGPLAAIYYVYMNSTVPSDNLAAPYWVLVVGGAGIVFGLATYGYNVIRALGVKMAKMTPARGYSAELSVAFTVAVASAWGMPISTTHCIVGAEVAVGMCEHVRTGVNWMLFAKTVVAWVATMAVSGLLSAALFAQGVYAPNIAQAELHVYGSAIQGVINDDLRLLLQSTNLTGHNSTALYGNLVSMASQACGQGSQTSAENCAAALRMVDAALKAVSLVAVGYNASAANFTNTSVTLPVLVP